MNAPALVPAAASSSLSPAEPGADWLPRAGTRVVVALSGGVDSSVALLRVKRAGADVVAVFMKNWDEDDDGDECPAARDLADARRVCERLDVPLRTVNLSADYWDRVFVSFVDDYRRGLTPNPDVLCNRAIKFDVFAGYARDLGARFIATGHHARIGRGPDGPRLLRGRDADKDQSYFLHALTRSQLASALFPIGHLHKRDVRRYAREAGLATHDKKDSTGVCFIGERRFAAFLRRYIDPKPGRIESVDGEPLGEHPGLAYYTIGQRQGLGIGGRPGGDGRPWYVAGKDLRRNVLLVAQGHAHPALHAPALVARSMHWIAGAPPARDFACTARIRHRQPDQRCRVAPRDDGTWRVDFDTPQRAIAPGQSVALYAGDECLGGGVIARALA